MRSKRRVTSSLLIGVLASAIALASCGDSGAGGTASTEGVGQPSEAYGELLVGLENAAGSGKAYKAVRRAEALAPAEEAAIVAFCEIAWKVDVNLGGDPSKGPAIVPWIRSYAESGLGLGYVAGRARAPALSAALEKLRSTLDPASLEGETSSRYKRACFT